MAFSLQTPATDATSEVVAATRSELASPPGLSAPPSLESLWHAVRRHWALALSVGVLAGLLGGAIAWCVAPAPYTAQTLLELSPRGLHAEGEDHILTYQRTQTALLKSYAVIQGTLERPNVAELAEVRSKTNATEWLAKAITTDSLLGPEIIRVSLSGDHAEDTALLLNELIHVYRQASAKKEEGRILERMKQLKENYRECAERLRERRQTLLMREDEIGVDDPETLGLRKTTTLQQLAAMQTKRVELQLKNKETQIELDGLRELVKYPDRLVVSEFAINEELKLDAVMKKHFDRLTEIERNIQVYRRVLPPKSSSPDLQREEKERINVQKAMADYQASMMESVVARLRSKYVTEAKDSISKLERTLQFVKEQQRSVDAEIRRLEGLVSSLRGVGRPLDKSTSGVDALRDEVTQMELVLKKVGEEMGNLQAGLPATARVTQLEPAKPPTGRKRDKQYKAAGAVGFGLFGLVFLGVGLLEFRHRRVYTSEDVARNLGLNLLGTLPHAPEQVRQVVPHDPSSTGEHTILAEAVDGVRTQLLFAARHEARRVLMVTSAVAGEGKTSLASHLAASLARSGHKTLLIDGDLRNPAAHRPFGLPVQLGLAEALRGEMPVERLLRDTPVAGLAILTAGQSDRQAIQTLARDGFQKLLERLKGAYEFIILDACPVLPVTDALLLGQHADAVVLAVLRNFSRLPALYEAQRRLASLDIPMLGAVVLGESSDSYGVSRYMTDMKQ
jgi:capsular exopolysaccharide synthesis family protein